MQKVGNITTIQNVLVRSIRYLRKLFDTIEGFLQKVSQFMMRGIGIVIFAGGLFATIGWLLASINPNPVGSTWNLAVWLVIIGAIVLAIGMQALYLRYITRFGILGQYGVLIFLVGALLLAAGAAAVNLFILPWLFKLVSQFPNLGAQLQGAFNTVQSGTNTAVSTTVQQTTSACNTIANNLPFGGGTSCPSTSAPAVPSVNVPSFSLNDLLAKIGLPSIASLGTLGLVFMSGATLAPGCLIMGLIYFVGGLKRPASLLLILCALLNLGGQFFLHIPFLGQLSGVLLFLSLAWFGFSIWSPWKFNLLSKLLPSEEVIGEPEPAN